MNKVIVIGGNHHNTLGVVRALGQKGVMSYALIISKKEDSFVLHSKYVHWGRTLKSAEDAVSYILLHLTNDEGKKNIVLSCADAVTCALDNHYNELKEHFIFFNGSEEGKLNGLTNKYNMQQLAVACGLNIPQSVLVKDGQLPTDIKFPCVTKDVDNVVGSKKAMHVFYTNEQLSTYIKSRDSKTDLIVQQYIDKSMEYQLIGCQLNNYLGGGRYYNTWTHDNS